MRPTRLPTLAVVAVLAAAVTWGVLKAVYNSLPPLPWTGVPALLVVAVFETGAGRDLRRRITGGRASRNRNLKPADPLVVSRMLVLARATALAGALVTGLMLGFIVYLSGMVSEPVPGHDIISAALTCGAALVMTGAALYLEYCCRVPDGGGDATPGEDR
jgi:uncharacterized protein DUF3180